MIQAHEIYSEKSAVNVSLPAYIVYLCSSVMWFTYGFAVLSPMVWPMVISSVVAFTGGLTILIGILKYGDQDNAEKTSHHESDSSTLGFPSWV